MSNTTDLQVEVDAVLETTSYDNLEILFDDIVGVEGQELFYYRINKSCKW